MESSSAFAANNAMMVARAAAAPVERLGPTEADVERALANVEVSLKQEFEEAREIVPELVARETKYMDFLRVEGFDPQAAAIRIATYWKCRKILFEERWLLPLNQTGAGALSMDDVAVLREGSHVVFSRPGQGSFTIIDESRLSRPMGNTVFRILFYFTIPFADESTQLCGTAALHIVNSKPRPEPNLDRAMYDLVQASLPYKLKDFHVVQAYEENKQGCLDFLTYKETKVTGFRLRRYPNLIASDSLVGTLNILEGMGFKREQLPRCLGGSYDYRQYDQWIRERISIEDMMSSIPLTSTSNRLSIVPMDRVDAPIRRQGRRRRGDHNNGNGDSHTNTTTTAQTESESAEMIRKRNALKSRRSYHRRQLELFSLNEQVRVWKMRNAPLKQEQARLEGLLAMATASLANHRPPVQHDSSSQP